jgi:hypothetical protein
MDVSMSMAGLPGTDGVADVAAELQQRQVERPTDDEDAAATPAPEPGPWNPFADFLPKWLQATRPKKERNGAHRHARSAEQMRRARRRIARASRQRNRR